MEKIFIKQGYLGIFLFVSFNLLAFYFYPGGTIIDPSTEGYLFFYNFLSNLGEWVAKNGEDNIISAYLFNSSMLILAISYGLFYFMFLKIQFRLSDNNIIKTLLMVTILLSLISFVLVAVFPSESPTFNLHIFFVKAAFRLLFVHCLIQVYNLFDSQVFGDKIRTVSAIFSFILFLFILVMEFGPSPFENNRSLFIQVTSQKLIVFSIIVYFYFQVNEALKVRSS